MILSSKDNSTLKGLEKLRVAKDGYVVFRSTSGGHLCEIYPLEIKVSFSSLV